MKNCLIALSTKGRLQLHYFYSFQAGSISGLWERSHLKTKDIKLSQMLGALESRFYPMQNNVQFSQTRLYYTFINAVYEQSPCYLLQNF